MDPRRQILLLVACLAAAAAWSAEGTSTVPQYRMSTPEPSPYTVVCTGSSHKRIGPSYSVDQAGLGDPPHEIQRHWGPALRQEDWPEAALRRVWYEEGREAVLDVASKGHLGVHLQGRALWNYEDRVGGVGDLLTLPGEGVAEVLLDDSFGGVRVRNHRVTSAWCSVLPWGSLPEWWRDRPAEEVRQALHANPRYLHRYNSVRGLLES